jgi:hypothetical protein
MYQQSCKLCLHLLTADLQARSQQWYRRNRLKVLLVLRLSRTATQLIAYWYLTPNDIFKLLGGKDASGVLGLQASSFLVMTPLTQMQQALSCLLPFRVMLPVSCSSSS